MEVMSKVKAILANKVVVVTGRECASSYESISQLSEHIEIKRIKNGSYSLKHFTMGDLAFYYG